MSSTCRNTYKTENFYTHCPIKCLWNSLEKLQLPDFWNYIWERNVWKRYFQTFLHLTRPVVLNITGQPHWLAESRFFSYAAFYVLGLHPHGALTTPPDQHVALRDALSSNSSLCDPLQCLRNTETLRLFLSHVKLGWIYFFNYKGGFT